MLLVRDAQMAVLRQARMDNFRQRAAAHLRRLCEQRGAMQEVDAWPMPAIDDALAQCPRFHLHRESDVVRYLEIVCLHWRGRAPHPYPVEAMQILLAYGVDPDLKLDQFAAWAQRVAVLCDEPKPCDVN